jgi:hypothetical protein
VHRHVIAVALRAPRRGASDSPPGLGRAGQGGPVPARGPAGAAGMGAAPGGSRRAGDTPGRWAPARRCVTAAGRAAGVVPPPVRAAMLAAASRSRCPVRPHDRQDMTRPAGVGMRLPQAGQVEEVPRSSTSLTMIPAVSALSCSAWRRWPIRQARVRWLCRRPAVRASTPRVTHRQRSNLVQRVAGLLAPHLMGARPVVRHQPRLYRSVAVFHGNARRGRRQPTQSLSAALGQGLVIACIGVIM